MTIEQLQFSRDRNNFRYLADIAPVGVMAVVYPFANLMGPTTDLAKAVSKGLGLSALSLPLLFLIFAVIRPAGWSPKRSAVSAKTVTLWLAAIALTACVF